jgi:hypothetical protein
MRQTEAQDCRLPVVVGWFYVLHAWCRLEPWIQMALCVLAVTLGARNELSMNSFVSCMRMRINQAYYAQLNEHTLELWLQMRVA